MHVRFDPLAGQKFVQEGRLSIVIINSNAVCHEPIALLAFLLRFRISNKPAAQPETLTREEIEKRPRSIGL